MTRLNSPPPFISFSLIGVRRVAWYGLSDKADKLLWNKTLYILFECLRFYIVTHAEGGKKKRKLSAGEWNSDTSVLVQCNRTATWISQVYPNDCVLFLCIEVSVQLTFAEGDKYKSFSKLLNVSEVVDHFQGLWVITLCAVHGCF